VTLYRTDRTTLSTSPSDPVTDRGNGICHSLGHCHVPGLPVPASNVVRGVKRRYKVLRLGVIGLAPTFLVIGARGWCGGWSSSAAIRLCPHRSARAAFPHTALPEGHPDHALGSSHKCVIRGVGREKRFSSRPSSAAAGSAAEAIGTRAGEPARGMRSTPSFLRRTPSRPVASLPFLVSFERFKGSAVL